MLQVTKDYNSAEIEEIKIAVPFSLKYDRHIRELPYRRREKDFKPTIHIGQRKLLLNEILFLTNYGHLSDIVVYAGAAPGIHINYLASLFPNHTFHLWDPNPFDDSLCHKDHKDNKLKYNKKIKIYNEYFTNDTAKIYKNDNVIFWSDIRTVGDNIENDVVENMKMQAKWHKKTNAVMSMLKFRLPYVVPSDLPEGIDSSKETDQNSYTYLDGEIQLQVWAPQTSTETRLIVKRGCGKKNYDPKEYESRMFRFNNITRIWQSFPHTVSTDLVDYCFDCRAEIYILAKYCIKFNKIKPDSEDSNSKSSASEKSAEISNSENDSIENLVEKMIKDINVCVRTSLKKPPHGAYPTCEMCNKYDYIRNAYFDIIVNRRKKNLKIKGLIGDIKKTVSDINKIVGN